MACAMDQICNQAAKIRREVLETVVFRGEAVQWRRARTGVEWLDVLPGDVISLDGIDVDTIRVKSTVAGDDVIVEVH